MANELGTPDQSLKNYLHVLRRRRWWVVGLAVLCLVAACGYAFTAKKKYSASAQLLVQPSTGSVSLSGSQVDITSTDVLTELQLATSAAVEAAVTKKLGASAPSISASEVGQTNVIELTATSTSPAEAAKIANLYAVNFVAYEREATQSSFTTVETQLQSQITSINGQVTSLQSKTPPSASTASQITALSNEETLLKGQLAQLEVTGAASATGGLEVVSRASVPTTPSSPKPLEDGLFGLAVGLIFGLGVAFLVEYVDDKLYSTEDIERACPGSPVLALIPVVSSWRNTKKPVVVSLSEPGSRAAESYRSLRTSLQFAGHDHRLQAILVTSPSASEGKTSTASNLAVVLANAGQRVVVVSADLRKPRLAQFFEMEEEPGFTSVLLGQSSLAEVIQPVPGVANLSLLGTGPLPPNPAELLQSARTEEILEELKKSFDVVVIDSAPVLPVTDAVVLARRVDATVMVVAAERTKRGPLAHAVETLAQVNAPRVGIVLNSATREAGYGYYSYRYGYSAGGSNGETSNGNGSSGAPNHKEFHEAARGHT